MTLALPVFSHSTSQLQMMKLRLKELKKYFEGHLTRKLKRHDSNVVY